MTTAPQYCATGRRKNSIARVRLRSGSGQITVNNRSFENYFTRDTHRALIQQPLEATTTVDQYNIFINVRGGGVSGQAGAIRHGISRALLEIDQGFRERLRKEGFLTRDSRAKERKKYGQKGARARFQFSKR